MISEKIIYLTYSLNIFSFNHSFVVILLCLFNHINLLDCYTILRRIHKVIKSISRVLFLLRFAILNRLKKADKKVNNTRDSAILCIYIITLIPLQLHVAMKASSIENA